MEERRMEDKTRMIHKVYLNARKSAVLSGVRDVLSFDAKEVYLETEQGVLLIQGDELHVNRLSLEKGEIDIDGRIDSFAYSDRGGNSEKSSFFSEQNVSMTEVILGQLRFILWMMCGEWQSWPDMMFCACFVGWCRMAPCGSLWKICFLGRCQCSGIYFILKNARWTDQMVWCGCTA